MFTESDIYVLERAIVDGRGARTIRFSDQEVTFHSLSEMRALLAQMRREVADAQHRPSTRFAATSKGLG